MMHKFGDPPTTKQELTASVCPMKCSIQSAGTVMIARPPVGNITTWWSRCQRCLTYWETSPAGTIVALTRVLQVEMCPDCRESKSPTETHTCAKKQEA